MTAVLHFHRHQPVLAAIVALLWASALPTSTAKRSKTEFDARLAQVDFDTDEDDSRRETSLLQEAAEDDFAANSSAMTDSCSGHSLTSFSTAAQAQKSCSACINTRTPTMFGSQACKWCPLSQTCVAKGTGRGGPCPKRGSENDFTTDLKVTLKNNAGRCNDKPLWQEWMEDQFGEGYEGTFTMHDELAIEGTEVAFQGNFPSVSQMTVRAAKAKCRQDVNCGGFTVEIASCGTNDACPIVFYGFSTSSMKLKRQPMLKTWLTGRVHHLDAQRCFQWALDWPIETVPSLDKPGQDQQSLGTWACTSVLLRHGTLGMLSVLHGPKNNGFTQETDGSRIYEPLACQILQIKGKKGQKCQVRAYLIKEFERLRAKALQPGGENGVGGHVTQEMISSIRAGPLLPFKPGAGLSGSTFAQSWDGKFMLKLGLRTNSVNEPNNLIAMVQGGRGKKSLFEHFKSYPGSLLARTYGLLKIDLLGEDSRFGMWMQDASFHAADLAVAKGFPSPPGCQENGACLTRYDLKGKSRDQFREQKPDKMFTLENGDFRKKEMYMHLADSECEALREGTDADADFLNDWNMIDYSFFFVVVDMPDSIPMSCSDLATYPSCMESRGSRKLYTVSIIDYLNNYVSAKKLESLTHGGKFDDYGEKMSAYTRAVCRTSRDLEVFRPVTDAIVRHVGGADPISVAFRNFSNNRKMYWASFKNLLQAVGLHDRQGPDAGASKNKWKKVFKAADDHKLGYLDQWQFAWAFEQSPAAR